MAKTSTGTRVDSVQERVRSDILAGRLRPGDRLKFPTLCEQFQVSAGVVREALSRPADQGLVRMQPHQGFQVTPLSYDDLRELTSARIEIETMVFRLSVEHGDLEWETGTVAAHHMLARTPAQDPADESRPNEAWDEVHAAFHKALLAGCPNRRLLDIAMRLREEAELYRHWSLSLRNDTHRDAAGEHRELMEAAIARNADLAVERLAAHIAGPAERLLALAAETADAAAGEEETAEAASA
jgi:DNA-binding GntR family transcriptional regulator